ncbi:MAG TPA: hypothetical protein VHH72_04765 [Solirubrobacterales bacterium]|jgi:hypothetical protein|nr:hypothetical protein [Solirubrobacterales bacterium]
MDRDVHAFARLRRVWVGLASIVFAGALALAIGTAGAAPQIAVLGAAAPASPACPASCQAVARTTGFQASIGATKNPFVVPYSGKIVAWSIKLGAPSGSDAQFFTEKFGAAEARLAVLKPVMKKIKQGKPIYRLKKQTPVEKISDYFGTTTTFALQQPLKVKQNQILGLSVPTWAPGLALNQGGQTVWTASRRRTSCGNDQKTALEDTLAGRAQDVLGSNRAYGCSYKTARILYSATIVKDPNAAPPPAPKKPKK